MIPVATHPSAGDGRTERDEEFRAEISELAERVDALVGRVLSLLEETD